MYFVFEAKTTTRKLTIFVCKNATRLYLVAHVFAEPYVESEFFVPLC